MGYLHIKNLHQKVDFLQLFDRVYALEKIHGTSASITYKNRLLRFHSGGESYQSFKSLFDEDMLKLKLEEIINSHFQGDNLNLNNKKDISIHGEAYGGKQQRMSNTYGKSLKFIVFDVKIEGKWLDVPEAKKISDHLELDFVDYEEGPNTLEWLRKQRDRDSTQAIKNGMGEGKIREGIVIRPINESTFPDGNRAIIKYKRKEFCETSSYRDVDINTTIRFSETKDIVNEWVTEERLKHVIDQIIREKDNKKLEKKDMAKLLNYMIADIKRESDNEIEWNDKIDKDIRKKTAELIGIKQLFSNRNVS